MKQEENILRVIMQHRLRWLKAWLEMRHGDIGDARMNFLCIWYCTLKAYQDTEAKEKTREINFSFMKPISDEKIDKHIFKKIDCRKSPLWYQNKTIQETLNITDEEYRILDPDKLKRERQERELRQIQKSSIKSSIIVLYELGCSNKEIAEQTKASIRKIERVLAPIRAAEKEQRNLLIWQLWNKGMKQTEIAKKVGVNRETVSKVINDAGFSPLFHISSRGDEESGLPNAESDTAHGDLLYSFYMKDAAVGETQLHVIETLTNTTSNVLLIGPAGTGKSYHIRKYIESLPLIERRKLLLVAPTWKAALNLDGTTIHKAFELNPTIQNQEPIAAIPKALRGIETIIIDEISMLRIDVFNKIMEIIHYIQKKRKRTIRIIAVGDFGQLQPVATKEDMEQLKSMFPDAKGICCYHSKYWDSLNFKKISLHKIHRQEDSVFSEKLTQLKYGCIDSVQWFNDKCNYDFDSNAITIVPTNNLVHQYNEAKINELWWYSFDEYHAIFNGELTNELPAPEVLKLCPDCRIMILRNDKSYKNGQLGTLVSIDESCIKVRLDDAPGKIVTVQKSSWTLENGTRFTQYPVCLAYAITVNKVQGCTFDSVNIDRGCGFWLPGQLYVALSRCRTVNGIHLITRLKEKDLHIDEESLQMTM